MSYEPHETFIAPARPAAQLWRLVAGLVLLCVVYIALSLSLEVLATSWLGVSLALPDSPVSLLLNLFTFGFLTIGAMVAVVAVHKRRALSLFGPWHKALGDGLKVLVALVILQVVVAALPPWGEDGTDFSPVPNMATTQWLALLPLSLLALFIQTGSEEVLFRGYIQQQLAARFAARWVWILIPSFLFGLLHYAPDEAGSNAWLIVFWATAFGVVAADLTARTGTLGPAIALHAFNNLFAILIMSVTGPMDDLALFVLPADMADLDLRSLIWIDFGVLFVSWLAARLALRV